MTKWRIKSSEESIKAYETHRIKIGTILTPDTPFDIRPYKEPLTANETGFGYLGTIAQNKEHTHIQCNYCGFFYKGLGRHVFKKHGVTAKEYKQVFQLSPQTSLSSDEVRERHAGVSKTRPFTEEQRRKRIETLNRAREIGRFSKRPRKSLEAKNREGRCPDQLLEKINNLALVVGKSPSRRQFSATYGEGYTASVYDTFGSWNEALKIAGLAPNRLDFGSDVVWTPEMIIEIFKEFKQIENRPPLASDLANNTMMPSFKVVRRRFGTLYEARKAAGVGQYED